ncbi:tripartite tricarboxylate transporter permease [Stygiolobus caldivivus]|uniref:Uncharacterized protein n=1 Tax=Stygiolobus caldivivus TaxID=2824673 RepID=A0A8D5U551_9CREN|nr:tripartite tricarboxylate transporter permease [Stygiolobus caldivivus]BCU69454.1 hypothetical protein KN1_07510 [Stygiolobus caldivivus]
MLDSIRSLGDVNILIRKALLMVINGILSYQLSYSLIKNVGSAEIIAALVFALSFLVGDILIVFTAIGGIIDLFQSYIFSLLSSGKILFNSPDFIQFIISIVFLFIVPLIALGVTRSSRSFITSGALILTQINPIWSLLLFSGISQSDNYAVNVLSSAPLAILFIYLNHSLLSIVIIALLVIAAFSYSLKSYYGLIGSVFVALGYAFLVKAGYSISILSVIVSIAIYGVSLSVSTLSSLHENKKAYETLKNDLTEELKSINSILYTLKEEVKQEKSEFSNTINGYINEVTKLQDKVSQCRSIECEEEVKNELGNTRRMITIELNNLIFDKIKLYNDFSEKLKFLGINLPELEYPKEEIKIEEFLDFYNNLRSVIEKNILTAANIINSLIENLGKTLGLYLQKVKVINEDNILEKAKSIDVKDIDTKLNICLGKATEIGQLLLTTPDTFELKKELATLPLQPFTINKLNQASKILEKFTNITLSELSMSYSTFRDISMKFSTIEMKNLEEIINTLIIAMQSADTPHCEKVSRLYDSITNIEQMMNYVREKDVILQLDEIVDAILPQLKERETIELGDLGINEKYAEFLLRALNNRGITAKLEGNRVILRNNNKNNKDIYY